MNTVFIHTHLLDDGSAISHSHPYIPSSHHTHSCALLMSIAQFNASAATMEGTFSYYLTRFDPDWKDILSDVPVHFIKINVRSEALRGPPMLCLFYC